MIRSYYRDISFLIAPLIVLQYRYKPIDIRCAILHLADNLVFAQQRTPFRILVGITAMHANGNEGGGDGSWRELVPLIYTNPIRIMGVSFLSTPLNIEGTKQYLNKELMDKMKSRLGEFVPLFDKDYDVRILNTVHQYPQNIGVIIDRRCASSTESFLWTAKQSRKVKLFGVQTRGAFDASNVLNTKSPDGRFILYYASSLTASVPDLAIDEIGMQPDYYLDKSIPDHQWVEYVNEMLNL